MKRKPPKGYDSWIEVYDTVMNQNPELLLSNSIWFTYFERNEELDVEDSPKIFKVQIKTLLANCFLELLDMRMTVDETNEMLSCSARMLANDETIAKLQKLLLHLKIQE